MTQLAKPVGSSVREETDFDLLTTIGCADIDQDQAKRALETLYNRYGKLLKGVADNRGWDRLGVDSDALIQLTFLRVWDKAGDFDPRKRYRDTPEESAVKLWVLAIFKNAFFDEIRKLGRKSDRKVVDPQELDAERDDIFDTRDDNHESVSDDDSEHRNVLDPRDDFERDHVIATESRDVELVRQWLAKQTQGDRTLLLVSVEYIDFRTGKYVIPTEQLNGLAALLGVLPETIKVKRGRLLQRLKVFLLENR
jgi:RNA polymerase sigma factor (sigma-70 family)